MERIEQFINTAVGKSFNPDNAYGLQCKDLADSYAIHLFGNWAGTIRPANAIDVIERSNGEFFHKVYNNPNDPNLIPQRGDLVIWGAMSGNPYGHIALVESCDGNGVNVIEQDGFAQVPVRRKYYKNYICGGVLVKGWIRPRAEKIIGYQAPVQIQPTERKLKHDTNAREQANTSSAIFQMLKAGDVINMKGFITNGQNIEGESRWFVTARSGKYMWFGGFENPSTDGLADLTVKEAPKVEPPKAPEPSKALPVQVEIAQFQPEFDFVNRFVGAATSNQFYGRKNLKDEQGNYLKNIPNLYVEQMKFVDELARENSPIKEITIHNTANTSVEATLNEFKRLGSYKSSHLVVSNEEIVQCVKKDNTAFTNGSHESNRSSFTIEFLDNVSDERYVEVLKLVTKALGVEKIGKHRDHSATACPAKLSNEKFEELVKKVVEKPVEKPQNPPKTEVETRVEVHKNDKIDMSHNVEISKNTNNLREIKKMEEQIKKNLAQIQMDENLDELREMIPKKWRCGLYVAGECLALAGAAIVAYSAGVRLAENEMIGVASALSTVGLGFVGIIKMTKGKK